MIFKRFSGVIAERIFFYFCLTATIVALIVSGIVPTLDGPAHVYNAHVTDYIVSGNKFISSYYTLSKAPSPNYVDHYLLALFSSFLSFDWAEKLMQIICVTGFAVFFRRLVWQFNPLGIGLSVFGIPFAFTMLFYLGFYNFCLSFSILFAVVIYYNKWFSNSAENPLLYRYIILSLLTLLLYFTNGLAFLFAGFISGMFEIVAVLPLIRKKVVAPGKYIVLKRLVMFAIVWLPGLLLFACFMKNMPNYADSADHKFAELVGWIPMVRPLVVYTGDDSEYTNLFFYAMLVALGTAILIRVRNKTIFRFTVSDVFLFAFLLHWYAILQCPMEQV